MITKENNSKELLKQVGVEKIQKIIKMEETDIMESDFNNMFMDYYSKIINKSGLQERKNVFYNACLQTALKYDLGNNNPQTENAVFMYMETLSMDGFTHQNVDKSELAKLSPQDVQILIGVKMHNLEKEKNNSSYLYSNFSQNNKVNQVKWFAKEVQNEARKIASQRIAK